MNFDQNRTFNLSISVTLIRQVWSIGLPC